MTAHTLAERFALSRATAYRRFAELVDAVLRGERAGAEVVEIQVRRGRGAMGTMRAVRLPVSDTVDE